MGIEYRINNKEYKLGVLAHFASTLFLILTSLFLSALAPQAALAQSTLGTTPVATSVSINGPAVAYGDLIDYDSAHNVYVLSQIADDPRVFGIAIKDPTVVILGSNTDVPVIRAGLALVNVTLENGPIAVGDNLVASSIPGKAMRALSGDTGVIGQAREAFDGTGTSTKTYTLGGRAPFRGGTIAVELGEGLQHMGGGIGTSTEATSSGTLGLQDACVPGIGCVPFGILLRYLAAVVIAGGGLAISYRIFMTATVTGVASIGRNPRAKFAIESAMIINGLLATLFGLGGIAAAIAVIYVHL